MRAHEAPLSSQMVMDSNPLPNLDLIIRGVLYLYILSLPFKGLLVLERHSFLVLLVLLALWCAINRRHFFLGTPFDVPLLAFVLWVGVTIPFATFPSYSLKEFGKLLQQVVVFYAVIHFFRERAARNGLVYLLLGSVLFVSAYGLTQFEGSHEQIVMSFLPAEVWLTTYLVLFSPLCLALAYCEERRLVKSLYIGMSLLAVACLLLALSRAGLVSFFCELWVLAWLLRRRAAWVVAGGFTILLGMVALFLVNIDTDGDGRYRVTIRGAIPVRTDVSSIVHRFDIWAFSLSQVQEHALIGIGYGKDNFKLVYGDESEEVRPGHAPIKKHGTHNILLYVALHVGVPGLLLFVWLAVCLVRRLIREFRFADDPTDRAILLGTAVGAIGLGVRLMFDQMFVGTLAVQFWALVAVAVLHFSSQQQREVERQGVGHSWGHLLRPRSSP